MQTSNIITVLLLAVVLVIILYLLYNSYSVYGMTGRGYILLGGVFLVGGIILYILINNPRRGILYHPL